MNGHSLFKISPLSTTWAGDTPRLALVAVDGSSIAFLLILIPTAGSSLIEPQTSRRDSELNMVTRKVAKKPSADSLAGMLHLEHHWELIRMHSLQLISGNVTALVQAKFDTVIDCSLKILQHFQHLKPVQQIAAL